MYVNCQGALAIEIWPGIFILKNLKVHQNQKNGAKQPNGYILSAYVQRVPGMLPLQAFLRNAPERDFQKSESGTTFHCLPICISTYRFGPSWSKVTPQLPDKLSESKIAANSSGIKITCSQVGHKFKKRESRF